MADGGTKVATAYVEVVPKVDKGFKEKVKGQLPSPGDGERSGKGLMSGMRGAMTAGAVALGNIMSNVATDAAGKLAETFSSAFTGFADYEQLTGGVEKLFGADAAKTVQENAEKAFQSAGMSANQYMEQATSFSASLISSLGGDTQKAADLTDVAMRAMSDNVNTFGSDMGSVQNAFQGFAKQNYTMLDNLKLGYGGTKEEMEKLIADANEYAAANGQAADLSIDSFADIIQAIQLIQEKQNVAGTTAKEAASTVEGSINQAKAAWENWLTALGRDDVDLGAVTDQLVQSIETAASNAIPVAMRIIESIGTTLITNAPVLYDNALIAMSQIAAAAPDATPQVIAGILSLVMQGAMALLQGAPAFLNGALNMLSGIIQGIIQSIPGILSTLVSMIPVLVQGIASGAGQMLGGAMLFFDGITQALVEVGGKLAEMVVYIVTHLPEIVMNGVGMMADAGKSFLDGLVSGFLGGAPEADGAAAEAAKSMSDTAAQSVDGSAVAQQYNDTLLANFDMSQFEATASSETKAAIDAAALTADAAPISKEVAESAKASLDQNALDDPSTQMVENAVAAATSVDVSGIGKHLSESAASSVDTSALAKQMSQDATVSVKADLSGVNQLKAAAGAVQSAYASMAGSISSSMARASSSAATAASQVKSKLAGLPKSTVVKVNVQKGSVQLPHFSMSGDFNPKTKSVPTVSVSWWAKGGIFTEPTIFANGIGEAGPEAVLPLSRLESMLDESNGKYAGNTTNIYVDGIQASPESALYRLLQEVVDEAQVTRRRRSKVS